MNAFLIVLGTLLLIPFAYVAFAAIWGLIFWAAMSDKLHFVIIPAVIAAFGGGVWALLAGLAVL